MPVLNEEADDEIPTIEQAIEWHEEYDKTRDQTHETLLINGAQTWTNGQEGTTYHTVKGKPVWGLIWDPGAGMEVAGTQTLLEYCREVCWPRGMHFKSVPPKGSTSFSGIDGVPLHSEMRASIPIDLGPLKMTFETATIGGTGDRCPFLLSNDTARRRKMISHHNYFDNGDGLLVIPEIEGQCVGLRMLLTDSGHYLIPIDHGWNERGSWTNGALLTATEAAQQYDQRLLSGLAAPTGDCHKTFFAMPNTFSTDATAVTVDEIEREQSLHAAKTLENQAVSVLTIPTSTGTTSGSTTTLTTSTPSTSTGTLMIPADRLSCRSCHDAHGTLDDKVPAPPDVSRDLKDPTESSLAGGATMRTTRGRTGCTPSSTTTCLLYTSDAADE